jgi:hypothetical protein
MKFPRTRTGHVRERREDGDQEEREEEPEGESYGIPDQHLSVKAHILLERKESIRPFDRITGLTGFSG